MRLPVERRRAPRAAAHARRAEPRLVGLHRPAAARPLRADNPHRRRVQRRHGRRVPPPLPARHHAHRRLPADRGQRRPALLRRRARCPLDPPLAPSRRPPQLPRGGEQQQDRPRRARGEWRALLRHGFRGAALQRARGRGHRRAASLAPREGVPAAQHAAAVPGLRRAVLQGMVPVAPRRQHQGAAALHARRSGHGARAAPHRAPRPRRAREAAQPHASRHRRGAVQRHRPRGAPAARPAALPRGGERPGERLPRAHRLRAATRVR